jgi:hypothetical protein
LATGVAACSGYTEGKRTLMQHRKPGIAPEILWIVLICLMILVILWICALKSS